MPDGFTYGRLSKTVMKVADRHRGIRFKKSVDSKTPKGSHWYTNGTKDIMAYECPEGFKPGRTNIDISGSNNPMFGKPSPTRGTHMSEESKKKLKESLKTLYSNIHRKWITDGTIEKLLDDNSDLPYGFVYGRLHRN